MERLSDQEATSFGRLSRKVRFPAGGLISRGISKIQIQESMPTYQYSTLMLGTPVQSIGADFRQGPCV